ncbi:MULTISPECIES: class I SAM-dependent methyltransferase [Methanobrevibacter]|uniref:class I SAM-dependent methyltransferase n=1 Tax=Methanobrevibacter TaxID=2172 RepID=UPI002101195F|nr:MULTISPECIES: class I SAM-dependent methyltransferase [Methanobrevibacter]
MNDNDKILDIGCGGGINIDKFPKITKNNVDRMDYSEIAVTESIKRNQKSVYNKRCNIIQADVTNMSMNSNTYDIVTAFETIYF